MLILYFLFALFISNLGYYIHGSLFWSIIDFVFWPLVLLKWCWYREITVTVIQQCFSWFFT